MAKIREDREGGEGTVVEEDQGGNGVWEGKAKSPLLVVTHPAVLSCKAS